MKPMMTVADFCLRGFLPRCACLLACLIWLVAAMAPAEAQSRANTQELLRQWLQNDLWPEARAAGVSASTFNTVFQTVSIEWELPDLVPPGAPKPRERRQSQAEFRSPGAYFAEQRLRSLAATGRQLAARHADLLGRIEARFGVPGSIVIAIWGRESGFGGARIPHSAFNVLTTKAFMSTRPALFRGELIAALLMVERDGFAPGDLKSSWAGALGQPQFLPSSYLDHAVDFDGDGRRDIWRSVPDTLASIANYLADSGWQKGRDWGFEISLPPDVVCAQEGPDRARSIIAWERQGITRISGRPFPAHERRQDGMLLVPAGRNGPAFVVTPNFYVLKAYNNSDLYALFVGNLADRIAFGVGPFKTAWGRTDAMLRSDIARAQRTLEALGHDVGGADGLPGFKTRRSIGAWQTANGLTETCFPDRDLLQRLR